MNRKLKFIQRKTAASGVVVFSFMVVFAGCTKSRECVPELIEDCAYIMVYDPVCGCDERTYSNSGEAWCNSIYEYTPGPCN